MADHNDDLTATKTEGFKVGEKKTIEEYKQLGMFMPVNCRTCIYGHILSPLTYASSSDTCPYHTCIYAFKLLFLLKYFKVLSS